MTSKLAVTKKDIERTFVAYTKGERLLKGDGSGTPQKWFVRNPNNQELYPCKRIYTLAAHKFNKHKPGNAQQRKNFVKLGYEIVDMGNNSRIEHFDDFEKDVEKSRKGSPAGRKKRLTLYKERLKGTSGKPEKKFVYTQIFIRHPDVVAEVLERSKGRCENKECTKPEPFKKPNGKTYLEVHHKKQLTKGGKDSVENAIALCPNCHREAHYG